MTKTPETIKEITIEVLKETDNNSIMFGDCSLLDEIASRATHTNLMKAHPLDRHSRILTALEKSKLFDKKYFHTKGIRGYPYWRILTLN